MQFCWHARAQAFDAQGQGFGPGPSAGGVLPDLPAAAALQAALGSATFRIGATTAPAPEPGAQPVFETLTGGTSGTPRRIRRTQASWIASFAVNARLFGLGGPAAVLGRLVHSLALYGAVETLHLGGTLHLLEGLRPDRQRAQLAARGVGVLYATPAQLRLLAAAGGPGLPDLRLILVGGSKLDPGLRAALGAITPAQVVEFYGAAEASFITLADAQTPPGSVGRPYPGVDLIATAEGLRIRSPYLAQGYGGETGGARWQEGWLHLDEFGHLEDGYLYLQGRASRMVKIADQAVYPEEVETFLLTLPGVTQAAVLPCADALRGQVLQAVLQGDAAAEPAVLAALRARFGPLLAPRRLHWLQDWPLLASGKPDLAALARGLE